VIGCDLGQLEAETSSRDGFRLMLSGVGKGNVGAITIFECSCLSRSFGD